MQWINNLCRLCGKIGDICYNIFDSNTDIKGKALKCLSLEITEEDFKPKQICNICYNKINDFYEYIDICHSVNLKFESIYLENYNNTTDIAKNHNKQTSVIVSNKQHYNELSPDNLNELLFFSNNEERQLETIFPKNLITVEEVNKNIAPPKPVINQSKNSKTYQCPYCEKSFKRRINLTAHISVHTNIKTFKCLICPKTFAVKSHLTQHNKSHSELYKCQICHKQFQVPSKLNRHLQIHTSNKPFQCQYCQKAFSDKHNLNQHISCHLSEKNLPCNICEKLFKTKKHLNAHIKCHVNDKVFRCTCCEKTFRYKHNLKAHFVKHNK